MNYNDLTDALLKCVDYGDYCIVIDEWLSSLTMNDIKIGKIKYNLSLSPESIYTTTIIDVQGLSVEHYSNYCFNNTNNSTEKEIVSRNLIYNFLINLEQNLNSTQMIFHKDNKQLLNECKYRIYSNITDYNICDEFYNAFKLRLDKIYNSEKYKASKNEKIQRCIQSKVSKMFNSVLSMFDESSYTEEDVEALIIKSLRRTRIERILK